MINYYYKIIIKTYGSKYILFVKFIFFSLSPFFTWIIRKQIYNDTMNDIQLHFIRFISQIHHQKLYPRKIVNISYILTFK